ncbi:MAG: NUDIX domain-containing protein [Patescibacteria group bacterium]|jgi:8-oxo-dGTP pyrophosphatase MutT (NUDIX family)
MSNKIFQFGTKPLGTYRERPGAYAVVSDESGQILCLNVNGSFHLPGGGIDNNEDPKITVVRETYEESGCDICDLKYLGNANQYFQKEGRESMNKLGTFYLAKLDKINEAESIEDDHIVTWMKPEEFLKSNASDFAKWAVGESLKLWTNN